MEGACFSDPDVLRAVSLKWLTRLLEPYAAFLESRDLALPGPGTTRDDLDYQKLLSILMTPDPEMPKDLLDSFYYLHEMATPEAMDCLLEGAQSQGIPIDDDPEPPPYDVAIQVWLWDSHLVKHHHAERTVGGPYTFVYFQGAADSDTGLWTPDHGVIHALQSDLADWFERNKRGHYCMIQSYVRDDGMRFVVGHGDPARREGCVCKERHRSEFYRPERHDLVIYQPSTGELKVHAGTQTVTKTYSALFGRHLFGSDEHFAPALKYTLDPLKTDGERALVCSDVDGLGSVRLRRVQFEFSGPCSDCEVRSSDDVFATMREHHETIPDEARITEASFAIEFKDSDTPRFVSVEPSDADGYERESDSEPTARWFRKRGFALFCIPLLIPLFRHLTQLLEGLDGMPLIGLA